MKDKAWQLLVDAGTSAYLRVQKLRPMTRRRAEKIRAYVPTYPDTDEIYIMCHCGNRVGGTLLSGKPFEFHCINCERVWTGKLKLLPGTYIMTATEIIKRRAKR